MSSEWTYHASLNPDDSFIFYHAIGSPKEYTYKPLVVARQISSGINYRYICIATPRLQTGASHFALVSIHKPFSEPGYVVEIRPIDSGL